MVTFRASEDFAKDIGRSGAFETECTGSTVHDCIDQACRLVDERISETLLSHEAGERWRLKESAEIQVNGKDVRDLDGLGTPVAPEDVIEVRHA